MHTVNRRETKLIFREPAVAEALARLLLQSRELYGFTCTRVPGPVKYVDTYFRLGAGPDASPPDRVLRERRFADGRVAFQEKRRTVAIGNDWEYETRAPRKQLRRDGLESVLKIAVTREMRHIETQGGGIGLSVDRCRYLHVAGKEIGRGIEVELKAARACAALDPVVEYLRGAFGLVPARRSKFARALRFLPCPDEKPRKIILDMDPGVDDAIALLLALASPELDVLAVTTVAGNVPLGQTTRNACLIVDAARSLYGVPHVPIIAKGLEPATSMGDASNVHGADGLGGYSMTHEPPVTRVTRKPAPVLIAELLEAFPGEVTLISTGPLTNLAAVAAQYPEALAKARALVSMGGVFFQAGNFSAAAEFNIHRDPAAAAAVVAFARKHRGPQGRVTLPLTFAGLDVTHRVRLLRSDLARRRSAAARFLRDVSRVYMNFYQRNEGLPGCYLHDPLAVALVIDPSLCEVEPFYVEVETTGACTEGATIADSRPTRIFYKEDGRVTDVCVAVDAARARRLILDRVLGQG